VLIAALLITIGISLTPSESVMAQMNNSNNTGDSIQNQTSEFHDLMTGNYTPSRNDTVSLGNSLSQSIAENVKISLANASIIAEKEVGPNAHAEEVRIGVWNDGTMVYFVLVIDSNDHINGVVVNAENGKVIESGKNSFFLLML
jgi:uncharacterized membrane protein YkoI